MDKIKNFIDKQKELKSPHTGMFFGVSSSQGEPEPDLAYWNSYSMSNTYYNVLIPDGGSGSQNDTLSGDEYANVATVSGSSAHRDNGSVTFTWSGSAAGDGVRISHLAASGASAGTRVYEYYDGSGWVNLNISVTNESDPVDLGDIETVTIRGLNAFTQVRYTQDSASGWMHERIYQMARTS